jgi:pyruvate,water dikinase
MRDRVHMPRPWTRYTQEIYPAALTEGFRAAGARYGWLVDTLEAGFSNDFVYLCERPVDDSLVPERLAAAVLALESRIWREDVRRWAAEARPASIRAHLEIQAVDPAALKREELLAHLVRCREHHRRMIVQHHTFNGAAFGPIGDLVAHVTDWTGVDPARTVALARGVAPESAAESDQLDQLLLALRDDAGARELLGRDADPLEVIARLRELAGDAGRAATTYVDYVGHRLLDSFDVADPVALEVPEVLVKRLRRALDHVGAAGPSEREVAAIRDLVPPEHRALFDELLQDARLTAHIRDERGIFSETWAGGLMRRAILGAGAMLVRDDRIGEATHLLDASWAEMRSLVAGESGPTGVELAERARHRAALAEVATPDLLGDPPPPPPPFEALPPAAGRLNRAIVTAIRALFQEAEGDDQSDAAMVYGVAAAGGVCTGTARVITTPEAFHRLRQGDVLVTVSTSESFNTVVPLLGALVTDAGGLLSHAAIVSREYGIPSVVGTRSATRAISDGALVRVDGTTGTVEILG